MLKRLKDFLLKNEIILYDEQYRILNSIIELNKTQIGGGIKSYKNILGRNKGEIEYKINCLLRY